MPARYYLTCLWPGLSEIWWRGRISALTTAVLFALALNTLLFLRFLYPDWLSSYLVRFAFWVGIAAWIFCVQKSVRELPELLAPRSVSEEPDRYSEACAAFLRGDWKAAEPLLLGMLAIEPRDPPSLLLLSGVYRHTDRVESARLLISELQRLEIADAWTLEIDAEVSRIERYFAEKDAAAPSADSGTEMAGRGAADLTAA
ncbi:hypothetical protein [Stieleria varia]|uniref:Tetratricopeptide repeat protein n=1 Tax=Stieleria varia TaxID=2528005 RepID=A0A5C6A6A4_9BACT|nr:hypothetical protein [Stieleria varia]TWT94591.1 hypothetical protein Pla52n_54120 [Stieleria varia]